MAASHASRLNFCVMTSMNYFRCPVCTLPLNMDAKGATCDNHHRFDRAKEGYLNLLPVHLKHSREPGDPQVQLQARRHFLRAGYFSPLVHSLSRQLPEQCEALLDIGCGEGFFTTAMAQQRLDTNLVGIDISKVGVRMAARTAQQQQLSIHYAVASSYAMPLGDHTVDVITRIYAPSKDEELARVLKPQGLLIVVAPGQQHLLKLRETIYQQVRPHEAPTTPAGFTLVAKHETCEPLQVSVGEDTRALLDMTPFAWRMTEEKKQSMVEQGLDDSMHFEFYHYIPTL